MFRIVLPELRSFRVPVVYLTSAFLWFFSVLVFRRISKLRSINHREGFDSHPGHQSFLLKMNELLGRSFPCTSGVPHFAKERADRGCKR